MVFPYGLGGSEIFPILVFLIRLFLKRFFFHLEGGLEMGVIPEDTNHAFPLWFPRITVFYDRRFSENEHRLK